MRTCGEVGTCNIVTKLRVQYKGMPAHSPRKTRKVWSSPRKPRIGKDTEHASLFMAEIDITYKPKVDLDKDLTTPGWYLIGDGLTSFAPYTFGDTLPISVDVTKDLKRIYVMWRIRDADMKAFFDEYKTVMSGDGFFSKLYMSLKFAGLRRIHTEGQEKYIDMVVDGYIKGIKGIHVTTKDMWCSSSLCR